MAGLLLCSALAGSVAAQASAPVPAGVQVEVWTMGPGPAVWERFGHNAIVLYDPATASARAYDWGRFSFQQEKFFLSFATGQMRYWMEGRDADATLRAYAGAGRTVWRQRLDLAPAEAEAVAARVRANDTDATRFYRYDYYRDNCSTRVRDLLDAVLGGQLRSALDTVPTGTSYRSHTRDLVRGDLPLYIGLQLLLGSPTDRPITAWEEAFLPMALMTHLDRATRRAPDGTAMPLLAVPREALVTGIYATEIAPARSALLPLGLFGLLLAAAVAAGAHAASGWRLAPARSFAAITGVAGLLLWAAWLLTEHAVARSNPSVLVLSGLGVPLALMVRKPGNVARIIAAVVAAGTGVALVLAFAGRAALLDATALVGPANLALAWVVHTRARRYP